MASNCCWRSIGRAPARCAPECPRPCSIFILPPSRHALSQRLQGSSTDSDEVIERRLRDAADDIGHWTEFDYVVINDRFEQALEDLQAIVQGRGGHLLAASGRKWRDWRQSLVNP